MRTFITIVIIAVLGIAIFLISGGRSDTGVGEEKAYDPAGDIFTTPDDTPKPTLPNSSLDSATEVVASGVIEKINVEGAFADGPFIITLRKENNEGATIAVPSMGLPLCVAKDNIVEVGTLKVGMKVEARGTWTSEGEIVPCESPNHYLRIKK